MQYQALKNLMDRLTAWRVPGNAAIGYCGDREIFSYQSGFADVDTKEPMTANHYINIYSCTKPATVVAALQLLEKGYFLLDDPLYEFLPEYREMTVKTPDGPVAAQTPITIRQLFTMTAGLNYSSKVPAFQAAREITQGRMDTREVVRCLAAEPLDFQPGEYWQYSLCHDVLAGFVEVVSGKKFRDYMKENIFDPLGMDKTVFHNEAFHDQMATLYYYHTDAEADNVTLQSGAVPQGDGCWEIIPEKTPEFVFGPEYDSGGAGITTTVRDYVKFCTALARGGLGLTGERILAPGTVELLKTNQLNGQQLHRFAWAQLRGYGYGLGVRTMVDIARGGTTGPLGEFGWGGAAGASVYVDTKNQLALFYAHHMLNPQEHYYQPRVRNAFFSDSAL